MKRHLFYLLLIATTAFFNSCQKELSLENGEESEGLLQSDVTGECLPMTVSGIYEAGTPLVANDNYIEVTVDVSVAGNYTIYTDTTNGIYFRATGTFSATGTNTVKLRGVGTPIADGVHNFIVTYGTSICTVAVTTLPDGSAVPAVFTLEGNPGTCLNYDLQGSYVTNVAMTALNKVILEVNVTTIGTYDITTTASNGITFSGTGVLASTGPATITLTAQGTPQTAGPTNIAVTLPSPNTSTCSFEINVVGPAAYTVNCAAATVNGTYMENVALGGSHSIDVEVNVTTVGSYTITGSVNGMTFTRTDVFTVAGTQTITLAGSGTPTNDGTFNVTLAGTTGSCTVPVIVVPQAGGAAVFTFNCGSAVVNGTYTEGVALSSTTHTISIEVNVTTVGIYNITGTVNGMTFSKNATFTTLGNQTVTLEGGGTPTNDGSFNVSLTGTTPSCNVPVTVNAAVGQAVFTIDCSSANVNGLYIAGNALTATHTVDIDVNVTTVGTYNITASVNGMTFSKTGTFTTTGVQTVQLAATGTPTAGGLVTVTVSGGTAPCDFEVPVFFGVWQFTAGAVTYTGLVLDAILQDQTLPSPLPPVPVELFAFYGETTTGAALDFILIDPSQSITATETYNMAVFTGTQNTGGFYFTGPGGAPTYDADFGIPGNTIVATVATHNTGTKRITGSFQGKAEDENGVLVDITAGTFSVTYP